ncbi:NO-inducible flavohemoprotein [Rhizobiaceae bacterium n13]|uniref:nitric oxide dioxygenase n=1 Tax=Ferirhizobium litorale TaxID=2927786 RepID=A0AAE3U420_9HYPH|nr:NO-inducible flavohemoprotein [Fererhizobium litorale]MDI7862719.1 NO-inducible flavohemoprotein [Fererhizobium litorale]MDI7924417.1 NO-inducible flavohemoprotein [Fererhizobium litorale]
MPKPLSPSTIELVKQSVPALAANGTDITKRMYSILFQDDHIRELFNHANQGESGSQVKALAGAILAYAQNIDNLGALGPVVERIAHKHIGYHILPEHYPYVAKALLAAIADVLGPAATPELLAAWGEAYWFLADILIGREVDIRIDLEARTGGWNGWRSFTIAEKIKESEVVTSFVLRPTDGGAVVRHKPGQYLTFRLELPDGTLVKRNYSISCGPNDEYYRISVKREANGQGGSIYLHDHTEAGTVLQVTPPAGDFYLPDEPNRPVVLLSGGVGLTPMVSMIEAIAAEYPELEAHFVHGALNSNTHAMDRHVRSLANGHGRIAVRTFYSEPAETDAAGYSHDHDGLISVDWLTQNTPLESADFYLCGPKPFLSALVGGLTRAGVGPDRIHYEFFGPADELLAA